MNKLIESTPLIKINYTYKNQTKHLFAKLEYYNLTGSIKDRVAYYMLKDNLIKKLPVVEATSGNTGIALSALCAYHKIPIYIYMPDWASKERISLMKSFGAIVTLISKEEGGFQKCLELAKIRAIELNGFLTNQFSNVNNYLCHYETTADEIINKNITFDSFVSGIGTGGTLMGVGDRLKELYNSKTIAIEPEKMPLIKKDKIISNHKIEGIGDDFIPELVDVNKIDEIYLIDDDDSINMSKMLAKELGLGVGISSGANFLGCVLSNSIAVTIFPDDNKKYLSTDLFKDIEIKKNFISKDIKLINYEII